MHGSTNEQAIKESRRRHPKTMVRLSFLALALTWACSDSVSRIVAPPSQPAADVTGALHEDWIRTPAGLYHPSCVHEIPSGAKIDANRVVHLVAGTSYQIPACAYAPIRSLPPLDVDINGMRSQQPNGPELNGPELNHWVEWTSAYSAPGSNFRHIEADWIAPYHPTGDYSGNKTYYTFPGLQNGSYIIQPVLQYGSNGAFGGSYWTFASWHCGDGTPAYPCYYSTPMIVPDGESLHGDVTATNCAGGSCDWVITSTDLTVPAQTVYTISDSDNYYNAVGGSVEVWHVTSCSDFPGGSFFYRIAVSDQNGSVTPNWNGNIQSNPNPSCYFHVGYDATSSNLYCCAPPPPFTLTISGKQNIARFESAQYTGTPSNGTAPYTYMWRSRSGANQSNYGPWSSWYGTGAQNYTFLSVNSCGITTAQLEGMATDANGKVGDAVYTIFITNPC